MDQKEIGDHTGNVEYLFIERFLDGKVEIRWHN